MLVFWKQQEAVATRPADLAHLSPWSAVAEAAATVRRSSQRQLAAITEHMYRPDTHLFRLMVMSTF